ncbi:hypothetical protein Tco_1436623, partial [Tanacetum coccineum]
MQELHNSRGEDAKTQGRYDHDINVTTVNTPITTAGVSVSIAEPSTPPTTTTVIKDEDLIITQTLMKMRSKKSKEKAKERGSKEKSSEPATRPTRGVTMQEPKKPLKKKDQVKFDEEMAKRLTKELEAELEEEERADYELAQRLQAEEHGELTIEERSRLNEEDEFSFSAMLDDFDRQDMLDLYRLLKERFETASPEGYDRLLWGDLITLFEPISTAREDFRKYSKLLLLLVVKLLLLVLVTTARRVSAVSYKKNAYELKGKFLDDLHNNAFSGTN